PDLPALLFSVYRDCTNGFGELRANTTTRQPDFSSARLSISCSSGNIHHQTATTAIVPNPPITTDGTVPNHSAVRPDSKPPNSFDPPTNNRSTALTRPRIASGVAS